MDREKTLGLQGNPDNPTANVYGSYVYVDHVEAMALIPVRRNTGNPGNRGILSSSFADSETDRDRPREWNFPRQGGRDEVAGSRIAGRSFLIPRG
jgi:hypothetical protein